MAESREVELKFLCTPEDLSAVLAAAPAGDDETRELISVYFDTPDRALQKAGVSLRVRESRGRRVQTLKRGEGLSREEHESPIEGDRPDRDLGPLRSLIPPDGRLDPAFHVRVNRRQRTFRYAGAEIELALDQGEVSGGTRRSPICEVELELKSGPPTALFALARDLSRAAPLYLSFDGKAARGQALVAGAPLQARRTERVSLARSASAVDAFLAVSRNALGQIAANAAVLRGQPDPEAVHQLRVATRRFRSALTVFAPIVKDDGLEGLKADLRWLAGSCNDARDLDVFADTVRVQVAGLATQPPGTERLLEALTVSRRDAWSLASGAAGAERFRSLMIDATAWLETGGWLARARSTSLRARDYAETALESRARKVVKHGRRLTKADDAARHRLRIDAKKLRYSAEAFASLYPRRAAERYIGRIKTLQDGLGDLNDLAGAPSIVARLNLPPEAAFAAGELVGLRVATQGKLLLRAAKAFDRLAEATPFWVA